MILGVISIGITSLSFSYAWYASSARVDISGVDMYVRTERDLRLSTSIDGEFKNELTYKELGETGVFDPCSSMYKSTWMDQKKDTPEFYRYDMPLIDAEGKPRHNKANSGLFSRELFLKVDDDAFITIDPNMWVVKENESKNEIRAKEIAYQYPNLSNEEIMERLNSLKKCMRISILIPDEDDYQYYIIDPYKDGDTLLGGRLDLEKTGYYSHYTAQQGTYETIFGEIINRDKIVYDEPPTADTVIDGEETSFDSRTKKDVHPFNLEKSLENGMQIAKEDSVTVAEAAERIVIPMYHEVPKRIVVSIYMEGWDRDCTNAHMGASFNLGLGFKILREM